jgi:hypothetical protein
VKERGRTLDQKDTEKPESVIQSYRERLKELLQGMEAKCAVNLPRDNIWYEFLVKHYLSEHS